MLTCPCHVKLMDTTYNTFGKDLTTLFLTTPEVLTQLHCILLYWNLKMLVNIAVEYTMIVDMDTLTMEYYKYMVSISVPMKVMYCMYVCVVPPPQMITQPKNTTAADPFGAQFTCSANGYGEIKIEWFNENKQENLPAKVIISEEHSLESVTSVLFIPHVTFEDEGGYFCSVKIGRVSTKSNIAYLEQISKYIVGLNMFISESA